MQEKMNQYRTQIAKIERIEKVLAYEPTGRTQHFHINMNDEELQILLDALAIHKGVIRMRMQEELKK